MPKKSTTKEFIEKANLVYKDTYDYSLVEYIDTNTKVKIICKEHGEFEQKPGNHINNKRGCPKCGNIRSGSTNRMNQRQFIEKANKIHKGIYNYSIINYKSSRDKVKIICKEHGVFEQQATSHLMGHGCSKCGGIKAAKSQIKTTKEFLKKAKEVHKDKYKYNLKDSLSNNSKVKIICKEHGEFEQTVKNHLSGKGCSKCGVIKNAHLRMDTKEIFIEKAKEVHGNKYDYSLVEYIRSAIKVKIICKEHGVFEQSPNFHLMGSGCSKCANVGPSKSEQELYEFINKIVPTLQSDREILQGQELDIYIPSRKLAIEFNGLYWHSDKFRDKNYHLNKTKECKEKDIQLIHIFEDEWIFKKDIVKSRILNKIGFTKNKIYGRKCIIREVPIKVKSEFLDNNHIQGKSGSEINIGLYYNEELVSLMTFGKLRVNMGQSHKEDFWELAKFSNKLNTTVIGGASKLLNYFVKTYLPEEIISYADLRWSQGEVYEKLGFEYVHNSPPNYFYIESGRRMNRYNFRKSELIKQGFDKNKTEKQIMKERCYYRIYDCGTTKFVKTYNKNIN